MEVQAGVLEACEAQHYSMMVQPLVSAAPDFVERIEDILSRHRPDGLILTPPLTDHAQLLASLRRHDIPFASIAPRYPKGCIGVMLDEREAAATMVEHLVTLGHRRIAHILGDPKHGASVWRLAGYRDGLKQAGLKENPAYMIQGRFSFESGVAAARQLLALRQRPTAIFAADDDMAVGAIWAASEAGVPVPGEVSICGFDDTNIAAQVWPPLTTVHQPVREMGRRATEQLLQRVSGKGDATRRNPESESAFSRGHDQSARRHHGRSHCGDEQQERFFVRGLGGSASLVAARSRREFLCEQRRKRRF
jgi:LacI family transcriptional regulator